MTSGTKHCGRCDTTKPRDEFGNNRSAKDGLQTYCRECNRDMRRGSSTPRPARPTTDATPRRAVVEPVAAAGESGTYKCPGCGRTLDAVLPVTGMYCTAPTCVDRSHGYAGRRMELVAS